MSTPMLGVAAELERRLRAAFSPSALTLSDDSAQHAGHAGARPGGESHFTVHIVAEAFRNQSRLERQRTVYAVVADLIPSPVHALVLKVDSPHD